MKNWRILESKIVFSHAWYKLRQDKVELPNGKVLNDYFVSMRKSIVIVVPITLDSHVVFIREYKHGARKIVSQFPTGYIDSGENVISAAKRELLEETGYLAKKFKVLVKCHQSPAKNTNSATIVLAQGAKQSTVQPSLDNEGETEIEVNKFPLKSFPKLLGRKIDVIESLAAGWVVWGYLKVI